MTRACIDATKLGQSVDAILAAISKRKREGMRFIVAIAGAPGAGKSTLAEALVVALNADHASRGAILPMDGFHLDNALLGERGLLDKKGAPETFDADGFASVLARLRLADGDVVVPVFDRQMDVARAGGRLIGKETEIIVVEGNYLLLGTPEWGKSRGDYDLSVFIDVPLSTLKQRLIQRWLDNGHSRDSARLRALTNDIPNAIRVIDFSLNADVTISASGQFVKE